MLIEYRVCTRCIMDTTDPQISFNEEGLCSHCQKFDSVAKPILDRAASDRGQIVLKKLIDKIKFEGRHSDYDCIIGVSGGVDSTYVAYKVKQLGLKPLAVHFDSGWNSELAVSNIENIIKILNIDLFTYVVDWEEMKDLQLSFFKASVANCDIPTDHAFVAVLYKIAKQHRIKYILSGGNHATEFILPRSWGYVSADLTHLKAIHKKFGKVKLSNYPTISFFERYFYYPFIKGIKQIRLLDYMPYNKAEAKRIITEKLNWRDYGGKHYESIFTRFFQAYYLPTKFNYDKRKAHLSSLIVSGQITRNEALLEMESEIYPKEKLEEDKAFVAKKLGISLEEFDKILSYEIKTYNDYPSNKKMFALKDKVMAIYKS